MKTIIAVLALCIVAPGSLLAELSLPNFFSDHMVLQRDRLAAIWGTADPGAEVSLAFKGKTAATKAGADGRWRMEIETGAADAEGAALTVTSGDDSVTLDDVLVGEVWFASGQSNMFFPGSRVADYAQLFAKSDYPQLRMFDAPLVTAVEPEDDIPGEWTLCSAETAPTYSAVAFFFARKLHLDLKIPIGVIKSAWGGKPVETFTSREALNTLPATRAMVDATLQADAAYDDTKAQAAYQVRAKQWLEAVAEWKQKPADQRGKLSKRPQPPKRPLNTEGKPGVLFASMINPFAGYTMRGAIWYQGEGNAKPGAVPYDQTLPLMIGDWRQRWGDDFSFYYVQLANFRAASTEPGNNDPWPLLQDRMRLVLKTTPKTGMAIINDIGEAGDIHPKNKLDVGERLARLALAKDYARDVIPSGPLYLSSRIDGGSISIHFDHVGDGLQVRDGDGAELKRFEIAGADKVWHWADAKIHGTDSVIVSHREVAAPVAVRYAWAANPEGANLVNSDGLPASVFRTDDWDDVEATGDPAGTTAQEARRALAVEIRALAEKRKQVDRGSDEFKALTEKLLPLIEKFRAGAPKAGK